ncbi:MAG: 4Fe-4S binding protein [Leptospiraceae bacterium]|nr:4Fe-4S binding protein [Leptospiraceae bacterium]MDW8305823.1 4Fe-4S binding protein [Leptospiraceae bacterium]
MPYKNIKTGIRRRNILAWFLAIFLMLFYALLYWDKEIDEKIIPFLQVLFPGFRFSCEQFMAKLSQKVDFLSYPLRGKGADKWFFYGFVYTLLVVVMGLRFIRHYRHEKYQVYRTVSVMGVQLVLAFLVPSLLQKANVKEFYFSYFWPLKIEYFLPSALYELPRAFFYWGVFMSFIAVPVLTYFFGKRWYCSWVCGCGALANTAGDDFRHLSTKTEFSWKLEKITIYSILVIAIVMTAILFINHFRAIPDTFSEFAFALQRWYFFFIGAGFAGVVGTGFYPLAGTRVWCRFGCPLAAILGILQVTISRFRITTNHGLCIACGNCSTYCEMGIDVRAYAMRGEDIRRAACVGCGICQAVCPRGVLRLENRVLGLRQSK